MEWKELHEKYGRDIFDVCLSFNLDPVLLGALIKQESNGNPNAKSQCGAFGLTQVMPDTATCYDYDLSTPRDQIFAGAHYLSMCFKHKAVQGNIELALAAYNAGWGNVSKYHGMPPFKETRHYVRKVLQYADEYRQFLKMLEVVKSPRCSENPSKRRMSRQHPSRKTMKHVSGFGG